MRSRLDSFPSIDSITNNSIDPERRADTGWVVSSVISIRTAFAFREQSAHGSPFLIVELDFQALVSGPHAGKPGKERGGRVRRSADKRGGSAGASAGVDPNSPRIFCAKCAPDATLFLALGRADREFIVDIGEDGDGCVDPSRQAAAKLQHGGLA